MLSTAHIAQNALRLLPITALLTGCLSVQIEGQVAGHDMGFIESSFAVQEAIVPMDPEAGAGQYQLLMSDSRLECGNAELLGQPNGENHTLAISLRKADGSAPAEGYYQVGARQSEDEAAATFVFTTGVTARLVYARAGEVQIDLSSSDSVEGWFWLEFDQGKFEGIIASAPCNP